ncbi:MAG: hypothetical protein KN64_01790 [Sulfurovum sp. AS07-7]|nr:MAG: hypothetical protein KN64_01790 [Sulfurovum sp. AS07-7]
MLEMKSDIKRHFYSGIIVTLLSIALSFGFKIYLANIVDKETLALYFTVIDIFSISLLILIGFRSSMVVAYNKTGDDIGIINSFRAVVSLLIVLVWLLLIPYIKHYMKVEIHYWYLVFTILSMGAYAYITNQLAMYREYKLINISSFLEPILAIVWFLIAYHLSGAKGIHALFISMVMSMLSLVIYLWMAKIKNNAEVPIKKPILDDNTKVFIKNSIISGIEFATGVMVLYMVVLFLMHYYSKNELGDFQVVVKPIMMAMSMLFIFPIFRFIFPELSKLIAQKEFDEITKLKIWFYKFSFIVSFSFIFIFYLFGQKFIALLFPSEYAGAYILSLHFGIFFIFMMLNGYQLAFIKASGEFKMALYIRLSALLFFVATFYISQLFTQNVVSVVMSLASSYVGMFAFSFYIEKKIMKRLQ